jgi:metal-responsive CopG/Arc/MetJ family transcriptional regulator
VLSQKKRGPPATGKGTLIGVRLQPPSLAGVDAWAAAQEDKPSRPEAIRRLVELSLSALRPQEAHADLAHPSELSKGTIGLAPDLTQRVDRWAKANGKASHSEAMRHLLELGLRAPKRK